MKPYKLALLIQLTILFIACNQSRYIQGERLYKQHCESCHMADAEGVANLYPALNNLDNQTPLNIYPCIIREGYNSNTNAVEMIGIPKLTDVEITNIINYLANDINRLNRDIELPQTKKWVQACKAKQD